MQLLPASSGPCSFGCALKLVNNKEQKAPGPSHCFIKLAAMVALALPISNLRPRMIRNSVLPGRVVSGSIVHKLQMMKWFKWNASKPHLKGNSESAILKKTVSTLGGFLADNQMSSGPHQVKAKSDLLWGFSIGSMQYLHPLLCWAVVFSSGFG